MNEAKKKKVQAIILIISVAIPFTMLLGFLIPSGKADENIPIDPYVDPRNEWHWEFAVDDQLIYELEMEVYDNETGNLIFSSKSIHIINITSFDYTNYDATNVSRVTATEYYYDCVSDSLKQFHEPYTLAMFGYNDSRTPRERYYFSEGGFAPFIIPRNGTTQDFTVIADILNESLYEPYQWGRLNYFNSVVPNTGGFNISFLGDNDNTVPYRTGDFYTGDFYVRIKYDSNDKLEYQEACILILEDDGNQESNWRFYNYTIKKVDEYNITDEIDWGVDEGDVFYYGLSDSRGGEEEPEFSEFKIDVNGFNYSMAEVMTYWGPINMTFQNVLGNISIWDDTTETYNLFITNQVLGSANNFYPFIPSIIENGMVGVFPNTTEKEDLEFMGDHFSMEGGIPDVPDENELEILFPEANFRLLIKTNESGIVNLWLTEEEGYISRMLFRKENKTIVDEEYEFDFKPITVENHKVQLNLTTTGTPTIELYYSVLEENPFEAAGVPFYEEIENFTIYIDAYTNKSNLVEWANLTIKYDEWELNNSGIPEKKIKVYMFNESEHFNESEWIELTENVNYTINTTKNRIEIYSKHLSFYAIGAPEEWNWSSEINIGEEMYYETTGTLHGKISEEMGIVTFPFVDFYIMNVTSMGLINKDRGDGLVCWMNQINAEMLYWDPIVRKLVKPKNMDEFSLNEYNYSSSFNPKFYMNISEHSMGFPGVIPLRFKKLHLISIGRALNESFYSSKMARDIGLPIWDEIKVNTITQTLILNDTDTDFYMALSYYNNGTIMKADFSVEFNLSGNMVEFNLTTISVNNYNHTDKVEWGVEIGDSYYFGSNFPRGGPTIEVNVTIVDINQTAIFLGDLIRGDDGNGDEGGPPVFQSWLTFSNVWAKIEVWNIISDDNGVQIGEWVDLTDLDIYANDTIIVGAANNYYPFPIGDYFKYFNLSGSFVPILTPKGIKSYDLAETFGDFLAFFAVQMMFEGEVQPIVTLNTTEILRIDITSPEAPSFSAFLEWYLDIDTGVSNYWYTFANYEGETFIANIFKKEYTYINYDGGPGPNNITFEFDNYIIPDINATVTVDYFGNLSFFEAVLYHNPVNSSLSTAHGNPMFFTDLFCINHTNEAYNLTFKMDLPARYPVSKIEWLAVYQYNPSHPESGIWDYIPLSEFPMGKFTKDTVNNNVTLEVYNQNGTLLVMVAWLFMGPRGGIPVVGGDDDDSDDGAEIIYGYELSFLLMAIALVSVALILKRRKIVEMFKK